MNNNGFVQFTDIMLDVMKNGIDVSEAIVNQEKRGQQSVVRNQRLPKKINDYSLPRDVRCNGVTKSMKWKEEWEIITRNNIEYTKQQYEKMGIVIIDEYDDLFWNVELPEGWEIKATDHTMWNNLFDDKGRKRANFFYKASFYDRDAFINFDTRFYVGVDHIADPYSDYDVWVKSDYQGIIKDGETIIFNTECVPVPGDFYDDDKIRNALRKQLEEYMMEHYPDYKDINAYWD